MIEKAKWYFAEVIVPKYVPAAVIAAVSYVVTFMLSHASLLEKYGVTTAQWPFVWPAGQEPSGMCTLIEWDTLKVAGGAGLAALVGVLIMFIQHHGIASKTEVAGGRREEDPPAKGA